MKAAPTEQRIDSLDLIRGVAILGILIMNITAFSHIGMAYINPNLGAGIEGYNGWFHSFAFLFADMRFMSMFSILFGAGMMLFIQNIERKSLKPAKYHYKRMLLLLGFGLIHAYLIWMGDILVPYALCGCLVFLVRNWSSKGLIVLSSILFMIPILMNIMTWYGLSMNDLNEIYGSIWNPDSKEISREIEAYRSSYMGQMEIRSQSAHDSQTFLFMIEGVWRYSCMMIIGILLFRSDWFKAVKSRTWYLRFGLIALSLGLVVSAYGLYASYERQWNGSWCMTLGHNFTYISSLLMAFAYMSLLIFWSKSEKAGRIQSRLKAVGRMAFTNYILSSVLCTFIFYGHGFAFFGSLNRFEEWGIIVPIWFLILFLSKWVLSRYKQGPLEFIWRKMTYW